MFPEAGGRRRTIPPRGVGAWLLGAAVLCGCTAPDAVTTERVGVYVPLAPAEPQLVLLSSYSSVGGRSTIDGFLTGRDLQREPIVHPGGIALDRGRLIVCDEGSGGIHVLNFKEGKYRLVKGESSGRLMRPTSIVISPEGRWFVGDAGRGRVLVLDAQGKFLRVLEGDDTVGEEPPALEGEREAARIGAASAIGLARSDSFLFVAEPQSHTIGVFDVEGEERLRTFGWPGADADLFFPAGLTCEPGGTLLVTDLSRGQVHRFSPLGELLLSFGRFGAGLGEFRRPGGIACDRSGRIYVADEGHHRVHVFDAQGRPLFFFGDPTGTWTGFLSPVAVTVDTENVGFFAGRAPAGRSIEALVLVSSEAQGGVVSIFGALAAEEPSK